MQPLVIKRGQQKLFDNTVQLSMAMEPEAFTEGSEESPTENSIANRELPTNTSQLFTDTVVEYANRKDLFDNNQRLSMISKLAGKYFFFHPQLEFF